MEDLLHEIGLIYIIKLGFSYVVKGWKVKTTRFSRCLRVEDTKRIISLDYMRPKSFGTFEKRAPDLFDE